MNGSALDEWIRSAFDSFGVVLGQEQASPPFPISVREFGGVQGTILNYHELPDRIKYGVPRIID